MHRRPENIARHLSLRLRDTARPETREWWENYVKGARFRGVPMGQIRECLHQFGRENDFQQHPTNELLDLADALIRSQYTEDKLAGILLIREIVAPSRELDSVRVLDRWAALFDADCLADWNSCDWFCVKVVGPLVQQYGEPCARSLASWSHADNLWRARAGLVGFVNHAADAEGLFEGATAVILRTAEPLIRRPERFAKTAVGWVLRELSLAEPDGVAAFCERHVADFSMEALRNATKKLPAQRSASLITGFKNLPR